MVKIGSRENNENLKRAGEEMGGGVPCPPDFRPALLLFTEVGRNGTDISDRQRERIGENSRG